MDRKEKGLAIARASERASILDKFNPAMLTTAREARGLSQKAVADLIGFSQPVVGKWEAGINTPDCDQVEKLSEQLSVPIDFFFVDRPRRLASMSDFYHRSMARAKRTDVKAIHARCSIIDLQVDRLLDVAEPLEDRIPSVDPDNHAGDIERVAAIARTLMGIDNGPIQDLTAAIERCGGLVIDRDMEVDDVSALCRWVPALPKLFFINGSHSADRVRFSLAHELGHTIMHFQRDQDPKQAEDEANWFAGAFLMPREEFRRDARGWMKITDLATLKRKWRVSMQAIAHRARQLKLIDENRYRTLFMQMSRKGWRKTEPVSIAREVPQAFRGLLEQHIEAGYTRDELAKLLLMSRSDIDRMFADHYNISEADGGPRLRIVR